MGCYWKTGTCAGVPTPCTAMTNATDCTQLDEYCRWLEGKCTGTPVPCDKFIAAQCGGRNGCTPGTSYFKCQTGCSLYASAAACKSPLCSWSESPRCTGTPYACVTITGADSCSAAGCTWASEVLTCSGKPTPCAQLSATDCSKQYGCSLVSR